ncbi:hypothetical protein X777_08132 [Ooceraea biroi]|uniref:Ionotropic glutamate receptor C-terminal domain-containing protein n=1 Tax=Ooceraea biroi TaxID=2015173 RepID=A0A026W9U7_OOCBI|nr:hypothetical protein X777_08132 [Ooceraea biroi]
MNNGVIWSKAQQTFVPISSIPVYAKLQQERFEQSRALETHNFQLQNLTLTAFEEPHFLDFHNNNTKISGLYGAVWNLLSESLNFTLQPVRVNVNSLGAPDRNSSVLTFKTGLLGIISRNETVIIPKIEMYEPRLAACDFVMPFWLNRFYLYTRSTIVHDDTWMVKIFSWQVWVTVLLMHVLLSVCIFLAENILIRTYGTKWNYRPFRDFLFYSYRNLCNQSIIPDYFGRSKMLEVSSGLFSYVMYTAYSALLFTYITRRVSIPPFDSLDSLTTKTNYKIVTLKGSVGDIAFSKVNFSSTFVQIRTSERLAIASTTKEMHTLVCSSQNEKYAIYQGQDEYLTTGSIICYLMPIGEACSSIWMGSGIVKNFKYKRTMDLGILKLREVGLLRAIGNHWRDQKATFNFEDIQYQIEMQQVSLVIALACIGAFQIIFIMMMNVWCKERRKGESLLAQVE